MSQCYVSAGDYVRYWPPVKPYGGTERRVSGLVDRRVDHRRAGHDIGRRRRGYGDRRIVRVIGLKVER
jgi:hypothetical protein